MISYPEIIYDIEKVAKAAGTYIELQSKLINTSDIKTKGLHDLVSYVDINAEKIIVEGLTHLLPEADILGEETGSSKKNNKYKWIVDPLDGTTNFLHGLTPYSVSIALSKKNEPIAGVIYEVSSKEVFSAFKSKGAYLNGELIKVSKAIELEHCLIGTGFPYKNFEKLDAYLSALKYFIKNTHGVRRQGSAAIDLANVACGRLDAFFECNLNVWDVAAGTLIVREAGGKVTDFLGSEKNITGAQIVASNNFVFDSFFKIVNSKLIP